MMFFSCVCPGECWEKTFQEPEILFFLKGDCILSGENIIRESVPEGQILFLPPGEYCSLSAPNECQFFVLRIKEQIRFCEEFPIEKLFSDNPIYEKKNVSLLPIHDKLFRYLDSFIYHLTPDFLCPYFIELKINELFCLFKMYYSKQELRQFFSPLISKNTLFSGFVLKHYPAIKTVKEFAAKANMSLSGFDKEFRKTFEISPYKWMMQKRNKRLLYEIKRTSKPLKKICEISGFSSLSQMNDYCKKHFGAPPGKIRLQEHKNDE